MNIGVETHCLALSSRSHQALIGGNSRAGQRRVTALEAMAPHGLGPARLPLVHVRRVTDAAGRPTASMRSENFLIYWRPRNGSFPERLVVESSRVGEGSQAVLLRFHRISGCFLSQRLTGLQSFLGPDPTFRWKGLRDAERDWAARAFTLLQFSRQFFSNQSMRGQRVVFWSCEYSVKYMAFLRGSTAHLSAL